MESNPHPPVTGHFASRIRASLPAVALVVFALWNLLAILTARCLYADGSHEFIHTLAARNFYDVMWSRQFAGYIIETPLVIAIKAGVTNLAWLRMAFSLGCLLPWPICLWLCHRIAPQHFWLALASCAAGYLNACFMAVGEHTVAHALVLTCGFVILFARPLTFFTAVVLLLGATGLLFSYESQFILGPPLIFLALRRVFEEPRHLPPASRPPLWHHLVFLTAAALFAAGVVIAYYGIRHPPSPNGFYGFLTDLRRLRQNLGWTFYWTCAWAAIVLLACWSDRFWQRLRQPAALILIGALVLIWGLRPLPGGLYHPESHYRNRILDVAVPLIALAVAAKIQFGWPWLAARRPRLIACTAVLLLAQSLWHISTTVRWHQDIALVQSVLKTRDGIVLLRTTPIAACALEGDNQEFDWTWPSLSLAFAPDPHIHSLICSELYLPGQHHGWQPFDFLRPQTFPDLSHYHIDYTPYLGIYTNIVLPP